MSAQHKQLYEGHINMYPPPLVKNTSNPRILDNPSPHGGVTGVQKLDFVGTDVRQNHNYQYRKYNHNFSYQQQGVGTGSVESLNGPPNQGWMNSVVTSSPKSLGSPTRANIGSSGMLQQQNQPQGWNRPLAEYTPEALRFYKVFEKTVKDAGRFTPETQLEWCETLLEYAFKPDFISQYSINAEKLKRELTPSECHKNRTTMLEHALKVLTKLMKLKYSPAIYLMGTLYSHQPYLNMGNEGVVAKNDHKALEYYKTAAKLHNPDGCYRAGVSFEYGRGVPPGYTRKECLSTAVSYYEKGAVAVQMNGTPTSSPGVVCSMYKLGLFQLYGLTDEESGEFVVGQDVLSAVRWFEKATENDEVPSPQALFELAKIYECDALSHSLQNVLRANRIPRDHMKALELYIKCAVKFNYPLAQWKLGHCFEFAELNLPLNPAKSIAWYWKAACTHPQGNPMAMLGLSGWYITGAPGVLNPDEKEAFNWAYRASQLTKGRLAIAEFAIGYFYEHGIGSQRNIDLAIEYYRRAAKMGHQRSIERLETTQQ